MSNVGKGQDDNNAMDESVEEECVDRIPATFKDFAIRKVSSMPEHGQMFAPGHGVPRPAWKPDWPNWSLDMLNPNGGFSQFMDEMTPRPNVLSQLKFDQYGKFHDWRLEFHKGTLVALCKDVSDTNLRSFAIGNVYKPRTSHS